MSLLIEGGRIVTAATTTSPTCTSTDETITLIGESLDVDADRVIDARGQVRPARAASTRTRTSTCRSAARSPPTTSSPGQTSCAFGGTTCHIDFANQVRGQSLRRRPRDVAREGATARRVIDYGFHIDRHRPRSRAARSRSSRRCPTRASPPTSCFMAYKDVLMVDDETMFKVYGARRRDGRARDDPRRERRRDRHPRQAGARGGEPRAALARADAPARARGRGDEPRDPARPCRRRPLYVVHVTCKESVEPIAAAREKGWPVWGETCTQYFFIDDTYLDKPNFEGAKAVFSPPVARQVEPARCCGTRSARTSCRRSRPTTARSAWDGQKTLGKRRLLEDPERRPGRRGPAA